MDAESEINNNNNNRSSNNSNYGNNNNNNNNTSAEETRTIKQQQYQQQPKQRRKQRGLKTKTPLPKMEQGDYFKMVESALSSLKSTRRSFHDIWCFIIMNYRIKADTKAYHNIQQALNTGVRDGLFQEYMCRGITRFKLNMDKRPIATKGHLKSVKVQSKTTQVKGKESDIKSPSSNNVPENRSNKRKKSGQTSPPKKKIKTQTVPSKSATAVVETQSVPR